MTAFAAEQRQVLTQIRQVWRAEPALILSGVLGVVLGAVLLVCSAVFGPYIGAEGNLLKAGVFNLAIGVFILNVALFLLVTGWGSVTRGIWRWLSVFSALSSYFLETYKMTRGIDPRFSRLPLSTVDRALGNAFGIIALFFVILFAVLAVRLFTHRGAVNAPLTVSLRYACVGGLAAMGVGVWMSVNAGPRIGAGDLLPLHAAGFHALQAIPVIALLTGWAASPDAGRVTHLAGVGWLIGCAGLAWHIGTGHGLLEIRVGVVVAVIGFTLYVFQLSIAARVYLRSRLP